MVPNVKLSNLDRVTRKSESKDKSNVLITWYKTLEALQILMKGFEKNHPTLWSSKLKTVLWWVAFE